jgi:hypothetical protein
MSSRPSGATDDVLGDQSAEPAIFALRSAPGDLCQRDTIAAKRCFCNGSNLCKTGNTRCCSAIRNRTFDFTSLGARAWIKVARDRSGISSRKQFSPGRPLVILPAAFCFFLRCAVARCVLWPSLIVFRPMRAAPRKCEAAGPERRYQKWSALSISAQRSPMMTQGAIVFPLDTRGMIDASAIRRLSIP